MKRYILILIFLSLPVTGFSQTQTENYIKSTAYKVGAQPAALGSVTASNKIESITYYDGLGRPKQNIAVNSGGSGQDIVIPVFYDAFGRNAQQYLPYADPAQVTPSLNYRDNTALKTSINIRYNAKFPGEMNTSDYNPFSETFYEPSPLDRPIKLAAPGKDWRGVAGSATDHTVKIEYGTNNSSYVRRFKVNFADPNDTSLPSLSLPSSVYKQNYYINKTLYKIVTKDENWQPSDYKNKTNEEFKDKQGRIILKRTYNSSNPSNPANENPHDTYYVYDRYSNLTYVIPPLAADQIIKRDTVMGFIGAAFPWVRLAKVDQKLAEDYEKELEAYEDKDILNLDLIDKYGGQGGFSILPSSNGGIIVNLNITTTQAMPLQTGDLIDLKELGDFQDKEQGRISGPGFEYYFLIRDNKLRVDGYGDVPSLYLNTSLTGNQQLAYTRNYPWTKILKGDDRVSADYEKNIEGLDNSQILTTYTSNPYEATGGIAVTLDEEDNLTVSINVNSSTSLELRGGILFPLDIERRLPNTILGRVFGDGYDYELSIVDNSLSLRGFGFVRNLNFWVNQLIAIKESIREPAIEGLCYIYHYDSRNRVIEKNIPGKGWEHIVYDKLDRPILFQDPNLRVSGKWIFTKYDAFNRVVYTGEIADARTRNSIQLDLDDNVNPVLWETRSSTPFSNNGATVHYSNNAFPTASLSLLTVNYYDDYNFDRVGLPFAATDAFSVAFNTNVKGLATGSKIRVLDTQHWITTITRYDNKARVIWAASKNTYLNNSQTIVNSSLDFSGNVIFSKTTHAKNGFSELAIYDAYDYDKMNRLKKHRQAQTPLWGTVGPYSNIICTNEYDELGVLVRKQVGGRTTNTTQLQTIDYTYNIRGWLRGINNIDDNFSLSTVKDLFAFEINYNAKDLAESTALYNGNISETHWKTKSGNYSKRSYRYQYDNLNRLKVATYHQYNYPLQGTTSEYEDYTEGPIEYDKNGNIMRLKRYGLHGMNDIAIIDDLTYKYMPFSNKLLKVKDLAIFSEGFNDGGSGDSDDYEYDNNGNMRKDLNKGLGTTNYTSYNYLNLPKKLTLAEGTIDYIYDATGGKLEKKVTKSTGEVTVTQYDGKFIYEKTGAAANVLKFFSHSEGYVMVNGSYIADNFSYIYQYKDHLGNTRMSYKDNNVDGSISAAEIIDENHYYAFGLEHEGYNKNYNSIGEPKARNYKYNGMELQDDVKYKNYDFGWRHYDPTIGRFIKVDRFSEKYYKLSNFSYAANNPVYFVDVQGDSINVSNVVKYDVKNKTSYLQTLIKDLESQTGLTISQNSKGQLIYKKDNDGNAIVSTYIDAEGNTKQSGSSKAREIFMHAASTKTQGLVRIVNNGSKAFNSIVDLDHGQINNFIKGARNIDPRTMGWGMTFLHEIQHTSLSIYGAKVHGDEVSDYSKTGDIVDVDNIIRKELNEQGGNYGSRKTYQSSTLDSGSSYMPFDARSFNSMRNGKDPAPSSMYIKIH